MSLTNYMQFAPRLLWKRGASPLYFVLFVTKNCNARCGHCLLGSHERHTGELTMELLPVYGIEHNSGGSR
jgi:MoaA/NifB/PqqE/SkfB family radical SAM enzyme